MLALFRNDLEDRCGGQIIPDQDNAQSTTFELELTHQIKMGWAFYDIIGSQKCTTIRVQGTLVKQ